MDKLLIEFNKKFDKQRQELIDGFKALGEEKRLPKALATIEGEQPTYKDYFKAGWQSRQAEVENLQEEYAETELYLRGQLTDRGSKIANLKYLVEQDKSHIQTLNKKLEEKDKRIERALLKWSSLASILTTTDMIIVPDDVFIRLDELGEALRGEHES